MGSLNGLTRELAALLGEKVPGIGFCAGFPGRPLCGGLSRPLCVLRLAKLSAGDAALGDLLLAAGEDGRAVYGKKALLTLRLLLHVGKAPGESGLEDAFAILAEELLFLGEPRFLELSRAEAVWQPREEVWRMEISAKLEVLLTREETHAVTDVEVFASIPQKGGAL